MEDDVHLISDPATHRGREELIGLVARVVRRHLTELCTPAARLISAPSKVYVSLRRVAFRPAPYGKYWVYAQSRAVTGRPTPQFELLLAVSEALAEEEEEASLAGNGSPSSTPK